MKNKVVLKFIHFELIKDYIYRTCFFIIQTVLYSYKNIINFRIQNILVIRLTHFGDFLLSLPVLQILKNEFPTAKISMVTSTWNRPLAQEFDENISEVWYYNVSKYCRKKEQRMPIRQKWQILKKIWKKRFDLVIDLDGATGFLGLYLCKRTRFLSSTEYLRFLQNLQQLRLLKIARTEYSIYEKHELFNLTQTLRYLGLHATTAPGQIKFKPVTEITVDAFFKTRNISPEAPIIGIHPSASDEKKLWSADNWAGLADALVQRLGAQIIFFGSGDDERRLQAIQGKMAAVFVGANELTLSQFIAAAQRCHLLICLDSMAQHIAFLWKIPAVVLYFQENYKRWAPPNDPDRFSMIYKASDISVEDVLDNLPKAFMKIAD